MASWIGHFCLWGPGPPACMVLRNSSVKWPSTPAHAMPVKVFADLGRPDFSARGSWKKLILSYTILVFAEYPVSNILEIEWHRISWSSRSPALLWFHLIFPPHTAPPLPSWGWSRHGRASTDKKVCRWWVAMMHACTTTGGPDRRKGGPGSRVWCYNPHCWWSEYLV
jgi:hypothetical protein